MFRNYIKIAWRNLVRRKGHALINIGGLCIGITVCLLIFLIVQFELSFDKYHTNKKLIFRVLTQFSSETENEHSTNSGVPFALPQELKTAIPQIEESATVFAAYDIQVQVLDETGGTSKKFKEEAGIFFTEPSLFDIFDFDWLEGNQASLKDPDTVILSKEIAEKYFGTWQEATGKVIQVNNGLLLRVTGVIETVPVNSDLQFKIVISYGTGFTRQLANSDDWDNINGNFGCYVLLTDKAAESLVNTQLDLLSLEKKSENNQDGLILQSLEEVHFDTESGNFSEKSISTELIGVHWTIAIFILFIACVNFINLSTAQAMERSKEVGVRKVLGSTRSHLKIQFLTETFLIVLFAMIFAIILAIVLLHPIGNMLDLPLSISIINVGQLILFLLLSIVLVTLMAGFYPSVVLSRFKAVDALKSRVSKIGSGGISLRRSLVVIQFVIAQALIIGTLIILRQMNFFLDQSVGFDKDAIINISLPQDSISLGKREYFRNRIMAVNGVINASYSSNTPLDENRNQWSSFVYNNASDDTDFYSIVKATDHNFLDTYKISLVAGRNISSLNTSNEFLVNETLLKKLGITDPQEALNKEIVLWEIKKGPIVGVMKDFQDHSFKDEISSVILLQDEDLYGQIGIKLASNETSGILTDIENLWNDVFPNYVFDHNFLEEKVANTYEQEKRLSNLYSLAAGIAIFLSALGLFGLASFMIVQRIKEAGIRKILGATKENIVFLFSREFLTLIVIAFCMASPLAWYFMGKWLEQYAYRIDIGWAVFVIGGITTLCIAILIVGYQAVTVANSSPIKSLRNE